MRFNRLSFVIFLAIFGMSQIGIAAPFACESVFTDTHQVEMLQKSIAGMRVGSKIPDEVYDQFSPNDIAKALVERVKKDETAKLKFFDENYPYTDYFRFDLKTHSEQILYFSSTQFSSILQRGFLNQHQVDHSNGTFAPPSRRSQEDNMVGLKLGDRPKSAVVRPKYAFLNIHYEGEGLVRTKAIPTNIYGNVGAVLKPEIKDRSLWTAGDSRNSRMFIEKYSKNSLDYSFGTFSRIAFRATSEGNLGYYESQIFGELTIKDVEYFIIYDRSLLTDQEFIQPLRATGKPLYLAEFTREDSRVVSKNLELLHINN